MSLYEEKNSVETNLHQYRLSKDPEKSIHRIISVKSTIREDVENGAIGLDLYEQAQELSKDEIESEYLKIRRKIDRRLLPILCITYTLEFLDKLSLNYASSLFFKGRLGINWSTVFLGGRQYLILAHPFWALPSNYIIQRAPVAKYTGVMLFVWAIILIAPYRVPKLWGNVGCQVYLGGMFEAGISPACMTICSMF